MKKSLLCSVAISLSVLLGGSLFVGCKTTGNERAADTLTSMQSVEDDILQIKAQLGVTSASLDDMLSPRQGDVKQAFLVYSRNAQQMQEVGSRFLKHTDAMAAQGANYFSEWSKEGDTYANPHIRAISDERRVELTAAFSRITQQSLGVREALQTYLSDINDLRTFLSSDLTPGGLEALKPSANRTIQHGLALRAAIDPVLASVADVRQKMSPGAASSSR